MKRNAKLVLAPGSENEKVFDFVGRIVVGRRTVDPERNVHFPYYRRLYIAQALWQLADTRQFEEWFASELPRMLRAQDEDGSWRDRTYGDCYATAMNCLVLALPEGLLPIFQR